MSILKNRCFYITKDDKLYACINVKKDFYVEGIIYESNSLLVGYFLNYNQLNCFVLNNSSQEFDCVSFVKSTTINQSNSNFDYYTSEMDEYCFAWLGDKKDVNLFANYY